MNAAARSSLLLLALIPLASFATSLTRLKGKSLSVALKLKGFKTELGPESLGEDHERLGQFSVPSVSGSPDSRGVPLEASILVDVPPKEFDLTKLREHVLHAYAKRTRGQEPRVSSIEKPEGFFFEFLEPHGALLQWNLYFESLHHGKWVELHFSSVTKPPSKADVAAVRETASNFAATRAIAVDMIESLRIEDR